MGEAFDKSLDNQSSSKEIQSVEDEGEESSMVADKHASEYAAVNVGVGDTEGSLLVKHFAIPAEGPWAATWYGCECTVTPTNEWLEDHLSEFLSN